MRCKYCNREIRKTEHGWLDDSTPSIHTELIQYQSWCENRLPRVRGEGLGPHEPTKESVILTILQSIDAL